MPNLYGKFCKDYSFFRIFNAFKSLSNNNIVYYKNCLRLKKKSITILESNEATSSTALHPVTRPIRLHCILRVCDVCAQIGGADTPDMLGSAERHAHIGTYRCREREASLRSRVALCTRTVAPNCIPRAQSLAARLLAAAAPGLFDVQARLTGRIPEALVALPGPSSEIPSLSSSP